MNDKSGFPRPQPSERALAPIVIVQPIDRPLLERLPADLAEMLPGGKQHGFARALGQMALVVDAIVPNRDIIGCAVSMMAAGPAYRAALKAGPGACATCGAAADPGDPTGGLSLQAAYARPEDAMAPGEIDDARQVACPACWAAGGADALLAAHMQHLAAKGGSLVDMTPVGPSPSPNLPRAERRRQEKAAKRNSAAMATICAAAAGVPTGVLYQPRLYGDWRAVVPPEVAAHIHRECVLCGSNPASGRAIATLMQTDLFGWPVRRPDGTTFAPVFRVCAACARLPGADVVNAMLDHADLRGLNLRAIRT